MKAFFLIISLLSGSILGTKAQNTTADFNKTLTAYFNTKNALAKDDANLASTSAKAFGASLTLAVKNLSAEQKAEAKAQIETIGTAASAITVEKAIATQRKYFGTLSDAFLKLTKELKFNTTNVYVQYCPMVKKSWLNEVKEIQNPYYGSMMYECGTVKETIAKK